jgi:hypothetical protein
VVAKVRERLEVNKQRLHKFHMERFNLKKLNGVEGKEQYRVEASSMFAALKDFDARCKLIVLRKRERKLRWGYSIRMDLGEVGWDDLDWIGLALNSNRCRGPVISVLNLRVS